MGSLVDWTTVYVGQCINTVLNVVCRDLEGVNTSHLCQSSDRQAAKIWVKGILPAGPSLCLLDVQVSAVGPVVLEVQSQSVVVPVPTCRLSDVTCVLELCCGLGAFTSGLSRLHLNVVAGVDENPVWQSLFTKLHGKHAHFIHGDINSGATLRRLVDGGYFHCIVAAGVHCQPFSRMGDKKGMLDVRSQSLPKALATSWTLQAVIVLLECVPGVMSDAGFQGVLRQFVHQTGYKLTQMVLHLQDSWCSRRDRWFGCLVAPIMSPLSIPPMPKLGVCETVRALFDVFPHVSAEDQKQIALNLYELSKYHAYALGGITKQYVDLDAKAATVLHSLGNQMYHCACGCRPPLSEERLKQRGLVGALVKLGTSQVHCNVEMEHCRYWHPDEMWALLGGMPGTDFGPNLRLAMAGIGQCVAPLMSLWVFAHVRQHLDVFLGMPSLQPLTLLREYASEVMQAWNIRWPKQPAPVGPASVEASVTCEPDTGIPSTVQDPASEVTVRWEQLGVCQLVVFHEGATVRQLLNAEKSIQDIHGEVRVLVAGVEMDLDLPLQQGWILDFTLDSTLPVPAVGVSEVAADWNSYAISTLTALAQERQQLMSKEARQELLARQGPIWGDDEVLVGLQGISAQTGADQFVHVWDPLLISGLVVDSQTRTWVDLIGRLGQVATVVTAVVVENHWFPVVWRLDGESSRLFTCGVLEAQSEVFDFLSSIVGSHRTGAQQPWKNTPLGFLPSGYCGALALLFVQHLLWGEPLVYTQVQVEAASDRFREAFMGNASGECLRPRLAALGLDPSGLLGDLLQQHGVAVEEVSDRVAHVKKALGEDIVAKAMTANNPWQELKWHANQLRPPLVLIKPSELQRTIDKRSERAVGAKKHKHSKGKGKGKAGPPGALDPTMLRLESGVFQTSTGQSLGQVALSSLSGSVSGVVLTTLSVAKPYMQSGKPLSSGALGFLLLDGQVGVPQGFAAEMVRIPLVCATNSEPLLVDAWLVQMGTVQVERVPAKVEFTVQSVPTCVVKAMVYRDLTAVEWAEVVAHPLKHIFGLVPPLQVCLDSECPGCECWHQSAQYPIEGPVVEVWSKQWLRLNFASCPPQQAEVFVRIPEVLQHIVQEFSGFSGIFLEPKSVDGRKPSDLYQVIWFPKASVEQLMVQRQTIAEVCGLARLGHKLGLRCKAEHAAAVFAKTKPGMTFLPAGKKQAWVVGPFPWGTLMSSVAAALKEFGWIARPVQPVTAGQHVEGLMYKVQSVADPPQKVFRMQHGDVLVTQDTQPPAATPNAPKVVAAQATKAMVSKEGIDELQINDPWAQGAARPARPPQHFAIGNPLEDMEHRVVQEVLAQIPKQAMEVDMEDSHVGRIKQLEQQMADIQAHTTQLSQVVNKQATEQASHMQDLQNQLSHQGAHFEQAINAQAVQLQSFQDTFHEQFKQQVTHQQAMLDGMFDRQMAQFESLLAKRHKPSE